MKILHIAPFNTANVPLTLVQAEQKLGFESRLVTLSPHQFRFEEDICLNLPLLNMSWFKRFRQLIGRSSDISVFDMVPGNKPVPVIWKPKNLLEKQLFSLRDRLWQPLIVKAFEKHRLDEFDIYQLDGGLGFLRSGKFIKDLYAKGKKIICCYLGSDLRRRGIIPGIDSISSVNITVEYDLQKWYPGIHYVPFPFESDNVGEADYSNESPVRIGHAPSNRLAKGSDIIIRAILDLKKSESVELVLIEGLEHRQALNRKRKCHIFVDQIGPLGYGINTLESLAMGIPVCSSLAEGFEIMFPDHPVTEITPETIVTVLRNLIHNPELRRKKAEAGKAWVRKVHDAQQVVRKIHDLVIPHINCKGEHV